MLAGTADYDVFGAVRQSSGRASIFGFTGEQRDATTRLTYLCARHLEPTLGRFTQADTVQPNAPGTQGWSPYAYVAHNAST
jgi:RHS repeat-associated protein